MNEMFEIKSISMIYNIWSKGLGISTKVPKNNMLQKTFKYYDSHIWNLLPNDIKNSTIIDNFKLLLKALGRSKC